MSGTANAVVTPTSDAVAFASAITDPVAPTGASFAVNYPCVADDATTPTIDESLCPTGVGNTPLAGFPTAGATYGVLTSGNAALADDPNVSPDNGYSWAVPGTPIGANVWDYQVARIDLPAATTSCLAFDFRFMSDEYPEFVDTNYNDAFIAQLDTWGVTADPTTQTVTAPGNFAGGTGDTISVDADGPSAMSDAAPLGVTYDGATALLTARVPVAVGSAHSLYLTIFDQGDDRYDSAVFLAVPPGRRSGRDQAAGPDPRPPGPRWFEPDSPITRVHGDASMFVGGLRALLLQSLHPAAMLAVAEHSGYRGDMWGRLHRTSTFLAVTTFGAADDAQPAVDAVRGSTSASPARCPTARRTPPPTRTCSAGCTPPRSTASCARTTVYGRAAARPAPAATSTSPRRPGRARGSACSTRRPPRPSSRPRSRRTAPSCAARPRPATRSASCCSAAAAAGGARAVRRARGGRGRAHGPS